MAVLGGMVEAPTLERNPPPLPPLAAGQRACARARTRLPARLVTFSGTQTCTLEDISRTGAKLRASPPPRVGAMVMVEGLPLEIFGTVRWTEGATFGIAFDRAIAHDAGVAMRRHADAAIARQDDECVAYAREWVQGLR